MKEIERKFLIEEKPGWLERCDSKRIAQGYLAVGEEVEVRLRLADGEPSLTVKRGSGESREEVEVDLTEEQFEALWGLTEGRRVEKRRFLAGLDDGLLAEVDVYAGELEGLVVAEVEFSGEGESHGFEPPGWFGHEVTGEERYANQRLALDGRPEDPAGAG